MTRADRFDRLDVNGSPHGQRWRGAGSPRRALRPCERTELERCPVFGKRKHRLEQSLHGAGDQQTHKDPEKLTPSTAICTPTRTGRMLSCRRRTQRHPDADLAALSLDDPVHQVERRERGRDQDQCGNGVKNCWSLSMSS